MKRAKHIPSSLRARLLPLTAALLLCSCASTAGIARGTAEVFLAPIKTAADSTSELLSSPVEKLVEVAVPIIVQRIIGV